MRVCVNERWEDDVRRVRDRLLDCLDTAVLDDDATADRFKRGSCNESSLKLQGTRSRKRRTRQAY